jgi:hypothetical protein
MNKKEAILGSQILVQMSEHLLMPFQRFWTMSDLAMGLEILPGCSFYRQVLIFLW